MENLGQIKISNDVIQTIAGFAALEVDGIDKSTSFTDKLFGNNGIKVEIDSDKASIDVELSVTFGQVIPEVCFKVQENIVNAVETMAGLKKHGYRLLTTMPNVKGEESRVYVKDL